MTGWIKKICAVVAFVAAANIASIAHSDDACDPRLETVHQSAPITYNAFDAAPSPARVTLSIRNAGDGECAILVLMFREGAAAARSPEHSEIIRYSVTGPRSDMLAGISASPPQEISGHTGHSMRLAAGMTVSLEAVVSVAGGQAVPPGRYTDMLAVALYRADGQLYRKSGNHGMLEIKIEAVPIVRVVLAGGGMRTTLDFGELTTGAVRSVNLLAHTNQGFRLRLYSEHEGIMRPVSPGGAGAGNWRVPYTVSVNSTGHAVLGTGRTVAISNTATGLAGMQIPVEVRIGDVSGQRAGIYRDVITIEIEPRG